MRLYRALTYLVVRAQSTLLSILIDLLHTEGCAGQVCRQVCPQQHTDSRPPHLPVSRGQPDPDRAQPEHTEAYESPGPSYLSLLSRATSQVSAQLVVDRDLGRRERGLVPGRAGIERGERE